MPHEHNHEQTIHTPVRAAAHHPGVSAISKPAVQAVQKMTEEKPGEEAVMDDLAAFSAVPAKFALSADNKDERPASSGIPPFQLKSHNPSLSFPSLAKPVLPPFSVIQQKKVKVRMPRTKKQKGVVVEVDHQDVMTAVRLKKVRRKGGISLNVGDEEDCYIPIDNLIVAVKAALSDLDEDDEDTIELTTLLKQLTTIKNEGEKQPVKGRKRKREKSPLRDRKKAKIEKTENTDNQNKGEEEQEDVMEIQEQVKDPVDTEEAVRPDSANEPLKFVAWNANHFGLGNDLDEKGIVSKIRDFEPGGDIKVMKEFEGYTYASDKIEGFLNVLGNYSEKLPVFSNTAEVNLLMEAVTALKYILERLGENYDYYKDKNKIIEEIAGSLKKHYMLAHSRNLLRLHPKLIMGFNEVGQGVDTMKQKLEGKKEDKDKDKGIQVEKGPRLQSITISVKPLMKAIEENNRIETNRWVEPVKKKERYGQADRLAQYEAYEELGGGDKLLRKGQIEYYPVAFNAGMFEYKGSLIINGTTIQDNQDSVIWTKNPSLTGYVKYRPIVVHRLALRSDEKKKEESNAMEESDEKEDKKDNGENEVWYGMVHTSPDGDEFDRREVYEEQLSLSLPALRNHAAGKKAQLIIGGDYYIAEEAMITTPPNVLKKGKEYDNVGDDDVLMDEAEIKRIRDGNSGRSVGISSIDKKYLIGKQEEVRNMVHPKTGVPYNFKDTLKNEKMKDVRSLTGTNENGLGLQSADYFIIDPATSKTYQTGIIDPVTGIPFYMESDNREMSDSWFSFSDHVPAMLVVSPKENDKAVSNAFTSNKGYFNNDPFSVNIFDLRYLQVSNMMAQILQNESSYPKERVDVLKEGFEDLKKKRKSGTHTEEDLILMNTLQEDADKLLADKKEGLDISTGMFEVYQARESYITTILFQIWSDIFSIKEEIGDDGLLDHIQDVRMILKEEKINAAYATGFEQEKETTTEARLLLKKYIKESSLTEMDEIFKQLEEFKVMDEFMTLKFKLTEELLQDLMGNIGDYINEIAFVVSEENDKVHQNLNSNYKLLEELVGSTKTTHSMRKQHDKGIPDDIYDFSLLHSTDEVYDPGGIPSRGNDCFLNSVCQLLSLPAYWELALETDVREFIYKVDTKEKIRKIDVFELRLYLYTLNRVKTMGGQEDAAELLGKLMDEIEPDLIEDPGHYEEMFKVLGSYERTILQAEVRDRFYDTSDKSIVEWTDGVKRTDPQAENILNIPIEDVDGLVSWLSHPRSKYTFTPDYDKFNTVEWAAMDQKWYSVLQMEEEALLTQLPTVLTIALKRFGNNLQKIDKVFAMPTSFQLPVIENRMPVLKHYELQGFIYHQGDSRSAGHYWTHKKEDDNWMKAEDESLTPSNMGSNNKERDFYYDIDRAYIYTYVHTGTTPVQEQVAAIGTDTPMEFQDDDKGKDHRDDEDQGGVDLRNLGGVNMEVQ